MEQDFLTKKCLCPSWPDRYYSLVYPRVATQHSALTGRRYYPLLDFKCLTQNAGKKPQQNSISNTYTPSAKQGGPEQPRGSPQRSRSVAHRRLPKDTAVQKREATKRGLRPAAVLTIRNALRTNKTKINIQYYRHFKTAASKHCYSMCWPPMQCCTQRLRIPLLTIINLADTKPTDVGLGTLKTWSQPLRNKSKV